MEFEIYTREGCFYCEMIKQVILTKGWNFTERKLFQDFGREEFVGMFGENATFPQVFINGNLTGGATESIEYLRENNLM